MMGKIREGDEMMMMRRRRSPEVDGKEKEMAEEEMEE